MLNFVVYFSVNWYILQACIINQGQSKSNQCNDRVWATPPLSYEFLIQNKIV